MLNLPKLAQPALWGLAAITIAACVGTQATVVDHHPETTTFKRLTGQRVFTVTTTGDANDGVCDSSHCSLREALGAANENPGPDTVAFSIPGTGPHEIHPESSLPDITDPITIDGTTQDGSAERLQVTVNGVFVGGEAAVGFRVTAGNSTIRGLAVIRWEHIGIELDGAGGNSIEGTYIGADAPDQPPRGNGHGIKIKNSHDNRIGGPHTSSRNIISGNLINGVLIEGPESTGNVVAGNYIGIAANGESSLGNGLDGVAILDAPENVIGGRDAGNVISSNGSNGVRVFGAKARSNRIVANLIGTAADGVTPRGNGQKGIWLMAPENLVGGPADGEGNVVAMSQQAGLIIQGPNGHGNVVQGNFIGTNRSSVSSLPNSRFGVRVLRAGGNLIGGTGAGEGNVIALNGSSGVVVEDSTGVAILGNSIWGNFELGIDLLPPRGSNPTNSGDNETGANGLQNFPVLEGATVSGLIRGVLKSQPNLTYRIELFLNPMCDGSGRGEGEIFKGHLLVTTDNSGHASFQRLVDPAGVGVFVATATSPSNNTSEFSRCLPKGTS
jgi:CSLREA domain-containing protein